MASRTRKSWKPQRDGQYVRQLGWKRGRNGNLVQPKFRLGTDLREAKRREMMLADLWEQVEQDAKAEPVYWPEEALEVAKQIARGGQALVKKRPGEPNTRYAIRVVALADRLPKVRLLPADGDGFREGVEAESKSRTEFVQLYEKVSDAYRQRLRESATKWGTTLGDGSVVDGPTLHEALRDHIVCLKEEYADASGDVTAWGRVRIKQVELLLERHDDVPLANVNHDRLAAASPAEGHR